MNHIKSYFLLLVILAVALTGCHHTGTVAHPNQISTFDGAAYDSLIVVQASLQKASVEVQAPNLAKFKPQLNQAIQAYNAAQAAYKAYHMSGTGESGLQAQLAAVVSQVAQLMASLGVKL